MKFHYSTGVPIFTKSVRERKKKEIKENVGNEKGIKGKKEG